MANHKGHTSPDSHHTTLLQAKEHRRWKQDAVHRPARLHRCNSVILPYCENYTGHMLSRSNIQEVLPTSHRCARECRMWKESNYVGGYTHKTVSLNPGWIHSAHLHPFHIEELDKGEEEGGKKISLFKISEHKCWSLAGSVLKYFTLP